MLKSLRTEAEMDLSVRGKRCRVCLLLSQGWELHSSCMYKLEALGHCLGSSAAQYAQHNQV